MRGNIKIKIVRKKTKYISPAERSACALTLVISLVLPCPVLAFDGPFDFDSGRWSSYDNYDDNATRYPPAVELPVIAPTVPVAPVVVEKTPSAAPPAQTPSFATFLTPTMPGLNKGFDVKISSTEDAFRKKNSPVVTADAPPDIRLPEKNWESPSIKKRAVIEQDDENQENVPLNIRMTFLPMQNLLPVPSPEYESARKLGHALQRKKTVESPKAAAKTPEEAAACAALDTYKKQQLDAIQGDRETLIALQDAIHSLGLSKQLGFMTEEHESSPSNQSGNQSFAPHPQ